jgi:hypothetical protein
LAKVNVPINKKAKAWTKNCRLCFPWLCHTQCGL